MNYQLIEVEPLTPKIGALVNGADLGQPVSDELFGEIHDAWMDHLVLFFRDQDITPEQHLVFGRRFGDLHIHPAAPYENDNPALMKIHTDGESLRNNGGGWHSDVSADEEPPMASILHIHLTPSQGGDTLWSNMYEAYDALSAPMQTMLQTLTATHVADYSGYYGDHKPQRESPRAEHPVVRSHPETGRKALFVNSGFTKRIRGVSRSESEALLGMLFELVKDPQFHCRFRWQANSIALWDNRCTQHMAVWDYYPETRSGRRVTVKGDKPFL
ncbi:MAG: TauD/TfdA family dioxygenase [Pseudomonadales bacterium]|jgi:taurine dioxygenase|nr:TauD/TfdA family dioxygenase [Pseudomonadales bacterium]MDP7598146.1 TauD/TfdA family dioxygenase [Pseudomonadales bacterium]HJN49509.1 TauD/TfdA family dioxygenase [Pseudomonadales bacterium]|tara:strand:+ start:6401 stop:7216 length:816 start_codon:yes stop_codon:yes gene_type:complete